MSEPMNEPMNEPIPLSELPAFDLSLPGEERALALSRQADLIPSAIDDISVLIVGCGGIGSNVAYALASMGVQQFTLFDPDQVALENVYPGHFGMHQIGLAKAEAVRDTLVEDLGLDPDRVQAQVQPFGYGAYERQHTVLVLATDELRSRRMAFEVAEHYAIYDLLIDARMGGTTVTVYALTSGDQARKERYNMTLEGGGFNLPCGQKATALLTKGMIPQLVSQAVYDFLRGERPQYGCSYDAAGRRLVTFNR